jgi:hypothetical protein
MRCICDAAQAAALTVDKVELSVKKWRAAFAFVTLITAPAKSTQGRLPRASVLVFIFDI